MGYYCVVTLFDALYNTRNYYIMEIIIGEREQAWRNWKSICICTCREIYESARLFAAFDISPIGAWIPSDISPKCLVVIFGYHCLPTLFEVTSEHNCDCANSWIFLRSAIVLLSLLSLLLIFHLINFVFFFFYFSFFFSFLVDEERIISLRVEKSFCAWNREYFKTILLCVSLSFVFPSDGEFLF